MCHRSLPNSFQFEVSGCIVKAVRDCSDRTCQATATELK